VNRSFVFWLAVAFLGFFPVGLRAGGSGLNVVIVVNQNSSNSVQLGNYYREQRHVPPQNFLRINWAGTNTEWTLTDYTDTLLNPLLAMLSARQLSNQIDYVVLSMDIPYRVNGAPNGANGTTSTLFYGFMPDPRDLVTCPLAPGSTNLYAGSESPFRSTPPISPASNSFLVTMITDISLAFAKQIVDQGVRSDGAFPTQTVILAKSTDAARNIRYLTFDNAVFNTRLRGNYSAVRTNAFSPGQFSNLLGYQNGDFSFGVPTNTFVPGAMADNLTSFGGMIFENTGQTVLLALTEAGACGSFGTVDEPCTFPQKFPDPQNYFFQARGFSLAECYYQSLTNPYQGLVVGEPLAAPFAQPGAGAWVGLASNTVLAATTNLSLQFTASDPQHPLQQVDLFLDGAWQQTLTNIPPAEGNVLHVILNGHATSYIVPTGAILSIASVASNLTAVLNGASYASLAKVQAFLHGDRIELQSTDTSHLGSQIPASVSSTNPSSSLTTFISTSSANYLDSIAWGLGLYQLGGTVDSNSFIRLAVTETNGTIVNLAITNTANTDLTTFTQSFLDLINTNTSPSLQDTNGLAGEDLQTGNPPTAVQFHLRARATGFAAAQIQVALTSSLAVVPSGAHPLTFNIHDLQPRNHLYITAGATNLSFAFPFNTTPLPDGYHELAAIAYEGSHVRTQTRATQNIRIQNTTLSATFSILVGDTNTALEATMQFAVTGNTNTISKIELFSTGGSLGAVTNQSSATFSVPATNLDLGLHPFYAIVTANGGKQYRTETRCIRLVGMDSPFTIQIATPPTMLVWPAAAGRRYNILSATNATDTFQVRDTITPSNSLGQWTETNPGPAQLFYQVRVAP
jgi:uncharacterized protein (TIGR03790 family)